MKIISKKREKEIEDMEQEIKTLKKKQDFVNAGYKVASQTLNLYGAISAILKTLGVSEIEIDNKLLYTSEYSLECEDTPHNTTIIRLSKPDYRLKHDYEFEPYTLETKEDVAKVFK